MCGTAVVHGATPCAVLSERRVPAGPYAAPYERLAPLRRPPGTSPVPSYTPFQYYAAYYGLSSYAMPDPDADAGTHTRGSRGQAQSTVLGGSYAIATVPHVLIIGADGRLKWRGTAPLQCEEPPPRCYCLRRGTALGYAATSSAAVWVVLREGAAKGRGGWRRGGARAGGRGGGPCPGQPLPAPH
eukprot:3460203-Rhodomonas_salina.1